MMGKLEVKSIVN